MFFNLIIKKIRNFFPKKHRGLNKYKLKKYQVYPEGKYLNKSLEEYGEHILNKLNFNKNKKIVCIGTCFAEEIANFLHKNNQNYKIHETNIFKFSVNWGRVYTSTNLRQILNYSLNPKFQIYFKKRSDGFYDPLRDYTCGAFQSKDDLIKNIKIHRALSKKTLSSCDQIFITLGQTEYWFEKKNNLIWGTIPSKEEDFSNNIGSKYKIKSETINDITNNINYVVNKLNKINSKIKIIFTLSPVPSSATFFNENVILKSFENKAKLKIAISNIIKKNRNVYYFPSFESVILDNHNFLSDNRHVKSKKVSKILKVFKKYI